MEFIKVYDLKKDKEKISLIQDATLYTDYAGLKMEHGLIGTEEWWGAIDKGLFPVKTIEGKISQIFMTGHGSNYPEFEIENPKERTQWTREGDDKYYVVGKKVRLTYVLQKFKRTSKTLDEYDEIVLAIEVEK